MVKTPTDSAKDTASPADVLLNLQALVPHLRAANRSPNTIRSYVEAVEKLDAFLEAQGMPRVVANIRRDHIEAFITDQLARLRPASAANPDRSIQQFFRWLVDEREIKESPMARMTPPTLPQEPPPVLRAEEIAALRKATSGTSFDDRRDRAVIELLYSSGIRRPSRPHILWHASHELGVSSTRTTRLGRTFGSDALDVPATASG